MSDWDLNIYYHPEKHGLTLLGEVDTADSYEFCKLVVWRRDADGAMFWATDQGCSCPSPFEDCASVDQLDAIADVAVFVREARAWLRAWHASADDRDALESIIRDVRRSARQKRESEAAA